MKRIESIRRVGGEIGDLSEKIERELSREGSLKAGASLGLEGKLMTNEPKVSCIRGGMVLKRMGVKDSVQECRGRGDTLIECHQHYEGKPMQMSSEVDSRIQSVKG